MGLVSAAQSFVVRPCSMYLINPHVVILGLRNPLVDYWEVAHLSVHYSGLWVAPRTRRII